MKNVITAVWMFMIMILCQSYVLAANAPIVVVGVPKYVPQGHLHDLIERIIIGILLMFGSH